MDIWKQGWTPTRVDDVIFKRHECEWVLPLVVAEKLSYNKQHVPAVQYAVWAWRDHRGMYVQIWEYSGSMYAYDKRVFAAYSGGTEIPPPSSSLLPEVRY